MSYKPGQEIPPPLPRHPPPDIMDTVDIPFDSIWCPVCSRQIVPKRIHVPVQPHPTPAPPASPHPPREHLSAPTPFILFAYPHPQSPKHRNTRMLLPASRAARPAPFAQGRKASSTAPVA